MSRGGIGKFLLGLGIGVQQSIQGKTTIRPSIVRSSVLPTIDGGVKVLKTIFGGVRKSTATAATVDLGTTTLNTVDLGTKTLGVAISDNSLIIASKYDCIKFNSSGQGEIPNRR